MKYFILIIIKAYQLLILKKFRRKCLFNESCSNYVLRITMQNGFTSGIKAFKYRFNNCRSNYYLLDIKGKTILVTNTCEMIEEELIAKKFLVDFKRNIRLSENIHNWLIVSIWWAPSWFCRNQSNLSTILQNVRRTLQEVVDGFV